MTHFVNTDSSLKGQKLDIVYGDGVRVPAIYSSAVNTPGLCPVGCEAEKIFTTHYSAFRDMMHI